MIKFTSDILIFDVTTSILPSDKDHAIEISAILLDKNNFLEKSIFSKPIKTSLLDSVLSKHAEMLNRDIQEMRKAGRPVNVLKEFMDEFDEDYILCSYHPDNLINLNKFTIKYSSQTLFQDKQMLSLWTLGYLYSRIVGLKKTPSFETLLEICSISERPQNTIENLRIQARLLSVLVNKIIES